MLALVAALSIPCTVLADNSEPANAKAAATQSSHKSAAANDPVVFNWVDGEPIHVVSEPVSAP